MKETGRVLPPVSEQSAAFKLFHYTYRWLVPNAEMADEVTMETYGHHGTGDAELDSAMGRSLGSFQLTPAKAAELRAGGVSIALANLEDAEPIYRNICQHLDDWQHRVCNSTNTIRRVTIPINGLREFDELARSLVVIGRNSTLGDAYVARNENKTDRQRVFGLGYRVRASRADLVHDSTAYNDIRSVYNMRKRLSKE